MRGKFNIYDIYIVNMKTNMRTNMRTRTNARTRTKQGGKVLASGGFGCVFTPALKCEGAAHREKGKVSKILELYGISQRTTTGSRYRALLLSYSRSRAWMVMIRNRLC